MIVRELMVQPVIVVREGTTLEEVARTLLERRIGCVPVVDAQGRLTGIVTESDFAAKEQGIPFCAFSIYRHPQVLGEWLPREGVDRLYRQARTMTAKDIMSTQVVTASDDEPIEEIIQRMLEHKVHRIPVVRDGKPVGMVARRDLLLMMVRTGAGPCGAKPKVSQPASVGSVQESDP